MKRASRFLRVLCACTLLLSAMLCTAYAVEDEETSPLAGETVSCKVVDTLTGEEETIMVSIPENATVEEQRAIVRAAAQGSLGIVTPRYDPITTGAYRLSYKHLSMIRNRSYDLGGGTLEGDMSVIYVDFINYDTVSATQVTVTIENVDKGDAMTRTASVSGERITLFVFRSQGVDMRYNDEIQVTGYSNGDLEADVYVSATT